MATFRTTLMPYAAGLAAVLALTGCGDGEERAAAPSVSVPSMSSVASSSVTAATARATTAVDPALARIPPAARPNTQAGAEAFGKFFIEQVARAWVEADPIVLHDLYTRDCKSCAAYENSAAKLKSDGHRHRTAALSVKSTSANSFVAGDVVIALPTVQRAVAVVDGSGKPVRATEADSGTFVLTLEWEDHWVVSRSQVDKSS